MNKNIKGIIGKTFVSALNVSKEINSILQNKNIEDIEEHIQKVPNQVLLRARNVIIKHYEKTFKMIPSLLLFKKLKLSYPKGKELLNELEHQGFLGKNGNRYQITGKADIQTSTRKAIKNKMVFSPGITILKAIIFLIGVGATYMSIFHSIAFLSDYYKPFRAILSASIMIMFNIVAAEMIIYCIMHKVKKLVLIFTLILTFGSIFSIGSTIIGLYNSRSVTVKAENIEINQEDQSSKQTKLKHALIVEEKEQIRKMLNSELEKRDGLVKLLNKFTQDQIKLDLENYNKMNGRRYVADRRIDELQKDYTRIVKKESNYLESNVVYNADKKQVPMSAYNWIGKQVFEDANPEGIQFWMSVYPAIFYDIIAPISFSIVFFMPNGKRKRK